MKIIGGFMVKIWANLSIGMQRLVMVAGLLMAVVVIGLQFHVSSQGDMSATYPKGFRGGTCTIESESLLIGYSGYFIPEDYEIPADAMKAMPVPTLCNKMPSPGMLDITIDLLYPEAARQWPIALTLTKMEGSEPVKTLLTIPERTYDSGIITQILSIGEIGEYRVSLSGKNDQQIDFALEIPITVGMRWYEGMIQFWPMVAMLGAVIFFANLKRILK